MSHSEIIAELPKLTPDERRQILKRIWELQEQDTPSGSGGPGEAERLILDQELEDYEADKDSGEPWRDVITRLAERRSH